MTELERVEKEFEDFRLSHYSLVHSFQEDLKAWIKKARTLERQNAVLEKRVESLRKELGNPRAMETIEQQNIVWKLCEEKQYLEDEIGKYREKYGPI